MAVAPIARTPSKLALDTLVDTLADARVTSAVRTERATAILDQWLGSGPEKSVIKRGERMFSQNFELPPAWQNMRQAVANRLLPAMQRRSPHMHNAALLVQAFDDTKVSLKAADLGIDQLAQAGLVSEEVAAAIRQDVHHELKLFLLPETLTMFYAQNSSPQCLREALKAQGYLIGKVVEVLLDKLPPMPAASDSTTPPEALTPEQVVRVQRIERFLKCVNPPDLEMDLSQVDENERTEVEATRPKGFLVLADSFTPEELDRLETFFLTDEGKEFRTLREHVSGVVGSAINWVMQSALEKQGLAPTEGSIGFPDSDDGSSSGNESETENEKRS